MAVIVDLISSGDELPAKRRIAVHQSQKLINGEKANVSSTIPRRLLKPDFDLSLDDDDKEEMMWSMPMKRRKLKSPRALKVRANINGQIAIPNRTTPIKERTPGHSSPASKADDDIVFISPPQRDTQVTVWTTMGSPDNLSDDSTGNSKRTGLSLQTAALLHELTIPKSKGNRMAKKKAKEETFSDEDKSNCQAIPKDAQSSSKTRYRVSDDAEKQINVAQREKQRVDKAAEKEIAKQAREDAKIAKAAEKQRSADLASVNRSKLDKNVTTPEIIVDFPLSMDGSSSLTQSKEFLRSANSETNIYPSEIPGIIKFRRKIRADFNDAEGCFFPVPSRIDDEKFILLYLQAEDFARFVSPFTSDDGTIEEHLTKVRTLHPNCRIIIIIEGLERLITKEKNASNRVYQAAVRRAAVAAASMEQVQEEANPSKPATKRKTKSNAPVIVDEVAIESTLLSLQIKHSIQIHHCLTPQDTGETILAMTQQLSLSRYRDPPTMTTAQLAVQPNFCMSTGQVPTGRNTQDTYLKILQQVIRVTEREATAIAAVHPNVTSLFRAFNMKGDRVLEDIMKEGGGAKGPANGTAAAERRIGPRTSERFARIFLGLDAEEIIG